MFLVAFNHLTILHKKHGNVNTVYQLKRSVKNTKHRITERVNDVNHIDNSVLYTEIDFDIILKIIFITNSIRVKSGLF